MTTVRAFAGLKSVPSSLLCVSVGRKKSRAGLQLELAGN